MNPKSLFKYNWLAFGLGDIRPVNSTYSSTDFNSLPPTPELASNCSWLAELHPSIDAAMEDYRLDAEAKARYADQLKHIESEAISNEIKLPDTFLTIAHSFELQERIPSCTACYFDLPETIVESPFRNDDFMLRFLNDQQVCVCWYIYFPKQGPSFVISSSGDGDEPFLDEIDFVSKPQSVQECLETTSIAGRSFDEFIYRFWIENLIWLKLNEQIPMNRIELDYVRYIAPEFSDPNGG